MAKTGQKVRLVSIDAGCNLKNRLAAMGLVPDVEIIVAENSHPGPFVIIVKTTRLVLGRGMVNKITVSTGRKTADN